MREILLKTSVDIKKDSNRYQANYDMVIKLQKSNL